ncbi:helicase [Canibacter zhoujuaniae]|uniref:helicase n=1 Tax=Canibacter zhoujuaniae TaxID=2708343 RepID=UPI001423CEDF|nr:helicase [Canibacter zhoujuaniae]
MSAPTTVAFVAVTAVVGLALTAAAGAQANTVVAESAADSAALAAADAVNGFTALDPCDSATQTVNRIARGRRIAKLQLVGCEIEPDLGEATVTVSYTVLGLSRELKARAGTPENY